MFIPVLVDVGLTVGLAIAGVVVGAGVAVLVTFLINKNAIPADIRKKLGI